MSERATRLWVMSPTIVTLSPSRCPFFSRIVMRSSRAWVGCSWAPSPALTTPQRRCRARRAGAPEALWRTTTTSGLIASMLRAVSSRLSPLSPLEPEAGGGGGAGDDLGGGQVRDGEQILALPAHRLAPLG